MRLILAGVLASLLAFLLPTELDSANLTAVADTLSTSRLSYYSQLSGAHTVGATLLTVKTSGVPSTSTANLFAGDTVTIGDAYTASDYTVDDIYDADEFQITAWLGSGDVEDGDVIIATRSATHTVTFTTATAIPNGAFRILVPSGANGNNDGLPNHDGFDYGVTAPSLTAPTGGGVTSWETATATASAGTGCTAGNHCFEARYNGTNSVTASLTFVIGGANKLINPAPASGHSAGTADTYSVTIQHLRDSANSYAVADSTVIKIAVIESVRVTATVDPSLTFTIAGSAASSSRCGQTTDVTTTATTVPFGVLTLAAYNDASQTLSAVTNGAGGYAVTIISDDQLSIGGDHTTEIINTDCDSENCTDTTSAEWSVESDVSGFGFSLENVDASTVPFEYSTATGNCTGSYCARMIPSTATASEPPDDSDAASQIMSKTTVPTTTEDLYVCYRLVVGTTQTAGDYENNITYVATATF
ncbi:MAG: hypothetical protein U1C50_02880 [Patescibacteria group bacterium]|nr:hypothetical protein [Patescibacteria group bacterium]